MALPKKDLELWTRLAELPLDRLAEEPAPAFGFIKRLMRDESWDYATAIRVVSEYRRFLLLAHTSEASPSPMVDAAWHLHLTYTRAYNIGLCERTLGAALHHTPSGDAEATRHYDGVYADTLTRYRELFGTEPPADIWPAPALPVLATMPLKLPATGPKPKPKGNKGFWVPMVMFVGVIWLAVRPPPAVFIFAAVMLAVIIALFSSANARGRGKGSGDGSGCGSGNGCGSSGGSSGGCDGGGGDGGGCGCGSGCGGGGGD